MTTIRKPAQSLVNHRIVLIRCSDPAGWVPSDVPGTVTAVSEAGYVDVAWDNGKKTVLDFAAGDRWRVILS